MAPLIKDTPYIDPPTRSTVAKRTAVPVPHRHTTSSEYDAADLRCGYSGKRCTNTRTSKKGGGLHRFCEFHRVRANKNQLRVDNKRRALRSLRRQQLKLSKAVVRALPLPDPVAIVEECAAVTLADVQLLRAMLFGSDLVEFECVPGHPSSTINSTSATAIDVMPSYRAMLLS